MGRLFGTDGARGVAITELSCELAMNIGRAAAVALTKHNVTGKVGKKPNILIGKDSRISSDVLEAAMIAGITSVGSDVELLGVVPTPAVSFLVSEYGADAGVMISASHNSMEYNGIKLFAGNGFKLPDEIELEIEELVLDNPNELKLKNGAEIGRVRSLYSGVNDYINHVQNSIRSNENSVNSDNSERPLEGLRVLFDCANGSASTTAYSIFTELGVDCEFINDKPNGININENCGSTHIELCKERMKNGNFDVMLAFDGDADRCLALDENGNYIDGDKMIAILSKSMKEQGKLTNDTAVVTVMSNLGFHSYMKENNINTVCTKVGDRYVLEEMLEKGYSIGGEQSGHIIFLDYAKTGDGQLTAVQLLMLIKNTGKKLSELVSEIKDYPQELVGVRVTEEQKQVWEQNEVVKSVINDAEKAFGIDGRILVRTSGTEPLIRVMIEGKDSAMVKMWVEKIASALRDNL